MEFKQTVGGACYAIVDSLSFQQCQWLGKSVFSGVDLDSFNAAVLHDVVRLDGHLAMAICCLRDGESKSQHARLSWEKIQERANDLKAELSPGEVLAFEVPFYMLLDPASVAVILSGKKVMALFQKHVLEDDRERQSPAPGADGSSGALSLSAEEMSPKSASSLPNGDQPTQSPISGVASNGNGSIAPSLAGSASSFHG